MARKKLNTYEQMLASIRPQRAGEYVFACLPELPAELTPAALIHEPEGYTVAITPEQAQMHDISYKSTFTLLNMGAEGSLDAVGLVSGVAQVLSSLSIPCNVFSGIHHTHLFVPTNLAEQTIEALTDLSGQAKAWLTY